MIKDHASMQEDLSNYFKSNPKEWEMVKWELDCQIDLAKDKAVEENISGGLEKRVYLAGIVQGLRIAKGIEDYYKKWQSQKKN